MVNILDIAPNDLIDQVAVKLKAIEEIKAPEWATYAKTGSHKERPPANEDWWYVRCAALLRAVYKLGPIGVSKLRTKYGGKKDRGNQPEKFRRASGSVIRKAFQQLEKAKLVAKGEKGVHKGRVLTPIGKSLLDRSVLDIIKTQPKRETPKVEKKADKPAKEAKADKKEAEAPKAEDKKAEVKPESNPAEKKEAPKDEAKSAAEVKPVQEAPKEEAKPAEKVPTAAELAEKAK